MRRQGKSISNHYARPQGGNILKTGLSILFLYLSFCVAAQDTIRTLPSISVSASRPAATVAQTPTQVLSVEKMEASGIENLSQAVSHLSGVTLKDYGGVGGIKTISSRGLGSQFSTLTIDGIAVSDCQNGQVDLGRYQLGNVDYVSFAQGQFNQTLQSARGYAAGNVLNMETMAPSEPHEGMLMVEGGSFGLLSAAVSWQQRLGKYLSFSLWDNYLQCKGDYPFTLYYTTSGQDSSSVERRQHSAVRMNTLDGNLFWKKGHREWVTKVHLADANHELPGPVIYYNSRNSEFTTTKLFFVQSRYHQHWGDRLRFQVMGKYSRAYDTYSDTAVTANFTNEYLQQEGYLSGTLAYEPIEHLVISFATDEALSMLLSNLARNNQVQRLSSQDVLALSYRRAKFDLTGNLLATLAQEHAVGGVSTRYQHLSPYAGSTLLLWSSREDYLRLRYFFKESYRLPNFNEMYYFSITRDLRPEKALQHNVGLTFAHFGELNEMQLTLDGYFNRVTDKIIAIPTQNLFLWSMVNLGRVNITGVDLTADWNIVSSRFPQVRYNLNVTYSYQQALDLTDPTMKTYGQQIPYTPRHSGGATLTASTPYVNVGYNLVAVGNRYRQGTNSLDNLVRGYLDQGITLSHEFLLATPQHPHAGKLTLRAQVLNLFDVQYEVVKNYPMMGRNYRFALTYRF